MLSEVAKARAQRVDFPRPHEHITHLMLANRSIETRETVAENIGRGQRTYAVPRSRSPHPVVVTTCGICATGGQLHAGGVTNALLRLPRF